MASRALLILLGAAGAVSLALNERWFEALLVAAATPVIVLLWSSPQHGMTRESWPLWGALAALLVTAMVAVALALASDAKQASADAQRANERSALAIRKLAASDRRLERQTKRIRSLARANRRLTRRVEKRELATRTTAAVSCLRSKRFAEPTYDFLVAINRLLLYFRPQLPALALRPLDQVYVDEFKASIPKKCPVPPKSKVERAAKKKGT